MIFKFKQFSISQDRCAMKVGTDGVLLGAWAKIDEVESILDIGTGTGIIALMLAQRSSAGLIDALEIDDDAYEQAVENFENSPWGDRLFCYHASLEEFADEIEEEYDLIVCNPPFYKPPLPSASLPSRPPKEGKVNKSRQLARFYDALPFAELLECTAKLLSENGHFCVIIPFQEEENFIETAARFGLYPNRLTRVKGTAVSAVKRSLLSFGFQKKPYYMAELILEKERHQYSSEYREMVKDFYLKL